MNKEDVKLLEANGWEVECQPPFEIYNAKLESHATGHIAELVLDTLKDKQAQENKIIEEVAQELVDGINKTQNKNTDINTLFTFGGFGLRTLKELVSIFFYLFKKHKLL
jgi:hypothetical protein